MSCYIQEVQPFHAYDPNSQGIGDYYVDSDTINQLQAQDNKLVQSLAKGALYPVPDVSQAFVGGNMCAKSLQTKQQYERGQDSVTQKQALTMKLEKSGGIRNFPDNLLATTQSGKKPQVINPFITEDEQQRMAEDRRKKQRGEMLRKHGLVVDDPSYLGSGLEKVNKHEAQIYDGMDQWVDKNQFDAQKRYLKFNTKDLVSMRVPQFANSVMSGDCSSVPLTRNQFNMNLTNAGRLPPHIADQYQCQPVRTPDGNSRFVCKKVPKCNSGYSYAGMNIDLGLTEKIQQQVQTRRVERSKLGQAGYGYHRSVNGPLGKTFKDAETAQKTHFQRMSHCRKSSGRFDKNGNYVKRNDANGQVWGDCQEVQPQLSNLAAYDSRQLFDSTPYGIPGTNADLGFNIKTQYQRGGLGKENDLIRAASAMNNPGSITHGNNLYIPKEGELKNTIARI